MSSHSSLPRMALGLVLVAVISLPGCSSSRKKSKLEASSSAQRAVASEDPAEWPLIPREVFFATPDKMRVRLNPQGTHLAFVAPIAAGQSRSGAQTQTLGIFKSPVEDLDQAKVILDDGSARFPAYSWTKHPQRLVFLRDIAGEENEQLHLINLESGEVRNITNNPKVKTRLVGEVKELPGQLFFSKNDRDPRIFDLHRLDLESGEVELVYENQEGFLSLTLDHRGEVRLGTRYDDQGNMDIMKRNSEGNWEPFIKVPFEDVTGMSFVAADWERDTLYWVDPRGRDKAALSSLNLKTGRGRIVAQSHRADITGAIVTEDGRLPLVALATHKRQVEIPLNQPGSRNLRRELRNIRRLSQGDFQVMSQTEDDRTWLLAFFNDTHSIHYYLWDRDRQEGQLLLRMQPQLDELPLAPMHGLEIPTRDGLSMVSYLTLPTNVSHHSRTLVPQQPLPMVLLVHGGPWARDSWGYNSTHQWLANRGYAVLSVNFRGSTGFGKSFVSASFGEWGAKMHDDLIDAVDWAIKRGIADPERVAIKGGSYGGYATLVGLTFTPEVFAAGVNIVGVSNLITMQESIPSYWEPFRNASIRRMGADVRTEEGRAFLWERSPLSRVEQIQRPLLIGHGDTDERVKLAEAEQIVSKMQEYEIPVTFARFPDEGHGFRRTENSQSFNGLVEVFLEQHLGGRSEDLKLVPGNSLHVPVGAEHIPGLKELLPRSGRQ